VLAEGVAVPFSACPTRFLERALVRPPPASAAVLALVVVELVG